MKNLFLLLSSVCLLSGVYADEEAVVPPPPEAPQEVSISVDPYCGECGGEEESTTKEVPIERTSCPCNGGNKGKGK